MGLTSKPDLSKLPLNFQKKNKNFWVNTITGQLIHKSKITDHLPKEETTPPEPKVYWWNKD